MKPEIANRRAVHEAAQLVCKRTFLQGPGGRQEQDLLFNSVDHVDCKGTSLEGELIMA